MQKYRYIYAIGIFYRLIGFSYQVIKKVKISQVGGISIRAKTEELRNI